MIAVSGCARVGDPCTLTAASASGATTATWVVAWKLGGKKDDNGQADWQVTDRTRLSAGLRYIDENKSIDVRSAMKIAAVPSLAMTTTVPK